MDVICVCVVSVMPRRPASCLVQRAADNKLAIVQQARRLPVSEWKASHVLAWLEIDMNMAAYGQACFDNIKSGKVSVTFIALRLHSLKTHLASRCIRECASRGDYLYKNE